jgi:hypothetical protein
MLCMMYVYYRCMDGQGVAYFSRCSPEVLVINTPRAAPCRERICCFMRSAKHLFTKPRACLLYGRHLYMWFFDLVWHMAYG